MSRTIAIIGAGFSGAITAINLLRTSKSLIKVILIDATRIDAKGLAYSTFDDNFVLNVPAQNMSAFTDKMDDFVDYCNTKDSALIATSFVSRRIYGEYLQHLLNTAKKTHQDALSLLKERVISLRKIDSGYQLRCDSGHQIDAHTVVLALGHFAPKPLRELLPGKVDMNAQIIDNPWDIHAIDSCPRDKDVLIVGAGHTAIDTLFRLESGGACRRVYLLSRHGLHPHGHRPIGEFRKDPNVQSKVESVILQVVEQTPSIRKVMRAIRYLIAHLDVDWRDVMNALRPLTPQIWQKLPPPERARFLRHVVPYWDVARHRLSPLAIKRLMSGIAEGRTLINAGSIQKIQAQIDGSIKVSTRRRLTGAIESFKVGVVINCTGPTYDINRTENELVTCLASNEILRQDEVKIGFQVDHDYAVNPDYPHLYYVGPMLKATHWEAIAVPELRNHTAKLARTILCDFG